MKIKTLAVAALSVTLAAPAFAGGRHHRGGSEFDYAKVVDVEPITKSVEHRTPRESCWTEQVRHEAPRQSSDSYTGTILGGVIGGAIGNAVGHKKRNKQVGTAVGAILGASIGHDISNRGSTSYSESYYSNERRCETTYDVEYVQETMGYWVTYKYQGREYRTRMDQYPGDRIRIRVTVEPA
ncbi:glycine zipper 2TM domain-containing protein [Hahella sp. HN01]|uniref:glycine zipper 2TM domain-containing protein n=1 Tax=Hahella sp. HN01 TaxID=2847262 RepID=UPI001C1ED7EF|nr:glycine zipper 2TM domain-containing protein [Hahella sp. HN01]MBU6952707.1 glycine zipper 2TM domain-containing protein [Hahella sp. HN01]